MRNIFLISLLIFGFQAFAHPVSYKDAFGIMSYNSPKTNELLLTYSLNPKFAVAGTYLRDSKSEFSIPRADFLLQRWNNVDSQGNFYLTVGSFTERSDTFLNQPGIVHFQKPIRRKELLQIITTTVNKSKSESQ